MLILADSHFSSKLVRSRSISLTPYDLRYPEKIMEKASRCSREVIAFGDHHWPGKPNHLKKDANAIVWPVRYALEQD